MSQKRISVDWVINPLKYQSGECTRTKLFLVNNSEHLFELYSMFESRSDAREHGRSLKESGRCKRFRTLYCGKRKVALYVR